ncbi:MAG: molybdopterin molybdotransferase MoeA [Planctomycetes bacterium]|nr:molybdopterin molybdotransferase MoeA [Planctomycetota bacterium]
MSETKEMIALAEALEIVERQLAGTALPTEIIPARQALYLTIVENQIARLDLPPFNKSAMDGYAIPAGDEQEEYHVIETIPAGGIPCKKLTPGTAAKIMTGAPVPDGTEKVIMVEQTYETDGKVRILSPAKATNICQKGEDVHTGDVILHAPAVLGPLEIANLISVGITEVKVTKPLRVALLATGSEIVDSHDQLRPGKIMNSNGPMLDSLCQKYSLKVVSNTIVTDDRDVTVSALREALNNANIVVLSGGVSVGDFDFVTEAMKQVGLQLHFNRVAIKPGKPMTFASSGQKAVFGLPGNPVAVYLMFHLFVLYAARLMAGEKPKVRYVTLPLACDFHRRRAERMAYLPCRLTPDGLLEPISYHGSAHLQALMGSDGFFIVPKDVTDLSAGEKVSYLSIKGSFE